MAITLLLAGCLGPTTAPSDLVGHIRIDGSTALYPLAQAAAKRFEKAHSNVRIDVGLGGSKRGIADVVSHKVDIGDSDIYADPAVYPDPNLTDHLVCVIPFAMVVNPDVTVTTLTNEQLIKIFTTGEYTNWRQLGGPNLPIRPVVRPLTSGTRATFRKYVIDGRDQEIGLQVTDSSQTVLTTVAHTPGAISYLALSVRDTSVNLVSINGVAPTPANIESGRYAFWGYEHMYTVNVNGGPIDAFLEYMLTPEIQQLAGQLGYIPISNMKVASGSIPSSGRFTSPILSGVQEGGTRHEYR